MLESYLKRIFETYRRGDAREESFYSTLEQLLKSYAESAGLKKNDITTLPKTTEAGNPDFRVWDGRHKIVGYLEAKKLGQNLDEIQGSEQLKRYRHTFPNLVLTNFTEFRLYRNGDLIDGVQIGRPYVIHKLKAVPPVENETEFLNLLEKFFAFSLPKTFTAKSLAIELAKRTRFLKDQVLVEELKQEEEKGGGNLSGFFEAFKTFLIAGLTREDFADLYAQTITYGLFAARTRTAERFSRKTAFDNIPYTIGILREVFQFVSLGDLPKQMEVIIDDISEVLAVADVNQILHKYFREGKGRDPIVHFYETFLAEYDPATREKRGVYYTPEPVVSYIVRSLHQILKNHFGREDGFATSSVRVLDPAAGTLTFLAEAAKLAVEEFASKYGEGGKKQLIHDHILKNFYAFELMMAPYAIGHLKMAFLLEELGYRLSNDERFKLYLTNTLEMEELEQSRLPGMSSLAEESHLAGEVKKETPILVILGNPPYSAISSNIGKWISKVIRDYYQVDGKPLGERNPKNLQDDYVKFIRFAQWKIEQAGEGVLGFITNHGYLDNPTFRGMRQSLMNTFDKIYLLDLHGNSLKKEICPDGSPDENVFDIRQGVAIELFVKKQGLEKQIRHADLWGLRESKYEELLGNDIKTTDWQIIKPQSEFYLFTPRDESLTAVYESFPQITAVFPVNTTGIKTHHDDFVIDFQLDDLKRRVQSLIDKNFSEKMLRVGFGFKDTGSWQLARARKQLWEDDNWNVAFANILYRPFDVRSIFYHDAIVERPRREVMRHMLDENLALISVRQVAEGIFNHAFISDKIIEGRVTLSNKGMGFLFPLYLYPDTEKQDLFSILKTGERKPNIDEQFYQKLTLAYDQKPTPEAIFYYIYGVLYSLTYRTKYAEFLKIDFPRIPFTANLKTFEQIGKLGKRLVDLHLVKSEELSKPIARFQGSGGNLVEKPIYDVGTGSVNINKDQYFEGISNDEWEYQIGGYQVLHKWLKDRKGRYLSAEDIKHYCRVVTAIKKTIEIQKELEALYENIEKETIDFNVIKHI